MQSTLPLDGDMLSNAAALSFGYTLHKYRLYVDKVEDTVAAAA